MYTVTIKYVGVAADEEQAVATVARLFTPNGAYIDTEAYNGTIYDTNVDGWGNVPAVEPFASTSVPYPTALAQFKLAMVGEDNEVEFVVEDYKEAFFYKTLAAQMKDQGFEITVEEATE